VTDGDAVTRAFKEIGPFDHLVTCAAGITIGPFTELPETALREFFEVKFWGQVRAIRAALPSLARDGSIVAVSGFLYRKPSAGYSAFAAVNGAIEALVKVLAIELAPIRVNVVSPGWVDTPIWSAVAGEAKTEKLAAMAQRLPVGRIGAPEDIADAIRFVMGNGFVTGSVLHVEGGHRLV